MKKKVLVVGGAGFLGSHVADALFRAGYGVRILDLNRSSWMQPEYEFVEGDVVDPEVVREAVSGCDIVYNFAALADLEQALVQPIETARINVLGNVNVLEECQKQGVKRFMYASTVYVNSRAGGFYRCSKLAAEEYVREYFRKYGLDYTILRYGSLYGPRAGANNGLRRIVKRAVESSVVSYEGSKEAMRDYIHVTDAAQASVTALEDSFKNKHLVLTGQEPMRVADLLKMLSEILGIEGEIWFTETHSEGHYVRTPYAYESHTGLKYVPPVHVDLGQGLLQLIEEVSETKTSGQPSDMQ